jgi:hypothetical protein
MTLRQLPKIISKSLLVRTQRDDDFFRAEDIEATQVREQNSIMIESSKLVKDSKAKLIIMERDPYLSLCIG